MTGRHVFLSYCRDNKDEVAKLRDDLIAADEAIWWDQDILGGQDWKLEIRKAMRDAYAVVVCLSKETADRITTGVYPEVLDAIATYREHAPANIFLIPLRLSECEIPLIDIDATRTLDRLQCVDLFAPDGLQKLVRSLQACPLHPQPARHTWMCRRAMTNHLLRSSEPELNRRRIGRYCASLKGHGSPAT
jgi:hypothetical protein